MMTEKQTEQKEETESSKRVQSADTEPEREAIIVPRFQSIANRSKRSRKSRRKSSELETVSEYQPRSYSSDDSGDDKARSFNALVVSNRIQ